MNGDCCSFSNIVRNNFVLLFSTKKKNENKWKENLFLMNYVIL